MTNILILDMDGTVRIKKGGTPGDIKAGFISHPEDQEIIPGAAKAIEVYAKEGWLIVGCSNQGGSLLLLEVELMETLYRRL